MHPPPSELQNLDSTDVMQVDYGAESKLKANNDDYDEAGTYNKDDDDDDNDDEPLTLEEKRERYREQLLRKKAKLFGGSSQSSAQPKEEQTGATPDKHNRDHTQDKDIRQEPGESHASNERNSVDPHDIIDRHASLLDQHALLKKKADQIKVSERERLRREESKLLEEVTAERALMAAAELAKGIKYDKPLRTGWRPSQEARHRDESKCAKIRDKYEIIVEGSNIPPICRTFEEMKLPKTLINELRKRDIKEPNPFQMQGLPVLFSGRDMIGIASTGSGKTLVFTLPLVMFCLEQQIALPFVENEGPFGLILCPSRDLAEQTYKDICGFRDTIERDLRVRLNVCLCIGGVSRSDQRNSLRGGCHMMVATPGRLLDNLEKRIFNLDVCRYMCLDEADRMLDNFEEELRTVFTYFKYQRQTVFFSATMPRKIQNFALSAMVEPVTVNVSGRAGAANKRIQQDVEYVKQEAKLPHLLTAIDKTGPPVMIFARRPQDVDSIHEYLLLKGLSVAAIHGQKAQEDRSQAVDEFRSGDKDILVATDVASKGLDFKEIKHVINFDMPPDIEDYTHRIGRTGRRGQRGLATTFINKQCDESTLLDLKALLLEAGQKVPEFLKLMQSEAERLLDLNDDEKGCAYCGGLGHRIGNCPKLEATQAKQTQGIGKKDLLASGGADW